jgi:hypothetical protein
VTRALLLIGAPGTGKSSTLEALGSLLERDGIAYGSIESEQLSMGWPLLPASAWIPALAAVLAAQRTAGRSLFLIAATPESSAQLLALRAAIATDTLATVCLAAPASVVASRIDAREPDSWPGKRALIAHTRALASTIPTFPGIDMMMSTTDRSTAEIAAELATLLKS